MIALHPCTLASEKKRGGTALPERKVSKKAARGVNPKTEKSEPEEFIVVDTYRVLRSLSHNRAAAPNAVTLTGQKQIDRITNTKPSLRSQHVKQ